eukprot:885871-Rhodomonas_salina.2
MPMADADKEVEAINAAVSEEVLGTSNMPTQVPAVCNPTLHIIVIVATRNQRAVFWPEAVIWSTHYIEGFMSYSQTRVEIGTS